MIKRGPQNMEEARAYQDNLNKVLEEFLALLEGDQQGCPPCDNPILEENNVQSLVCHGTSRHRCGVKKYC